MSTASGIRTAEDGTRYVGGSLRPDGTVRKTVKVRPGFVPAEDVQRYVPRSRRQGQEGAIEPKKTTEQPTTTTTRRPVRRVVRDDDSVTEKEKVVRPRPVRRTVKGPESTEEDLADQLGKLTIKNDKPNSKDQDTTENTTDNKDTDAKDSKGELEPKDNNTKPDTSKTDVKKQSSKGKYIPPHLRNK